MMRPPTCLYLFLLAAAVPALAADPPAEPASAAQATSTTSPPSSGTKAPSQPISTTTASSNTSAAKAKKPDLTEDERRLLSQGYRMEMHGGERTFCRREVVLGSHFEKKVCGTAEQLATSRQTSRDATELSQRHGTNPQGN